MKIGVPKEIKKNENRVALTPGGVLEMVKAGHTVFVQSTAGIGSGITDEEYIKAGASILPDIQSVYTIAEMVMKVKEPIAEEYSLIREGQLLFTYFHFASSEELTKGKHSANPVLFSKNQHASMRVSPKHSETYESLGYGSVA